MKEGGRRVSKRDWRAKDISSPGSSTDPNRGSWGTAWALGTPFTGKFSPPWYRVCSPLTREHLQPVLLGPPAKGSGGFGGLWGSLGAPDPSLLDRPWVRSSCPLRDPTPALGLPFVLLGHHAPEQGSWPQNGTAPSLDCPSWPHPALILA